MKSHYLPLLLAVAGGLLYHISQKLIPRAVNPYWAVILAYLAGIALCGFALWLLPAGGSLKQSWQAADWSVLGLGVGAVMIEIGFVLAYRAGWQISLASLSANVAIAVLLIPVGLLFYRDHLTRANILGLLLCLAGLVLLTRQPAV
jgi:drug/metabolite transporter (DMT)-like permease